MFHTLIYLSDSQKEMNEEDAAQIALQATANNHKASVTGFLTYKDKRFVQYLEGNKASVDKVFDRIQKDSRHKIAHTIYIDNQENRIFSRWAMRYIDSAQLEQNYFDNSLISILEDIQKNKYHEDLVRAQILTVLHKITDILYFPQKN